MNDKFSYYLERNNKLFLGDVLVVCYNVEEKEMEEYGLTSSNIVLFFKSEELNKIKNSEDCNYRKVIEKIFSNKDILLRIQSECLLGMYGDSHCDCDEQRLNSISLIAKGTGILIHMPQEAQGWGLHYKLKELDLQVSGRMPNGEFIGIKNRDDAQKQLLNKSDFNDNRNYEIIYKILSYFKIENSKYILMSENDKKNQKLKASGLEVIKYKEYLNTEINEENASEYLIKIANLTHRYDESILDKILKIINDRRYNDRTLSVIVDIVNRINNNKEYKLDKTAKKKILDTYNNIICGEEKKYVIENENYVKIQNNFSCKVDSSIFKTFKSIHGLNIFDRIALEKLYYFENKETEETIRIRTSHILDVVEGKCKLFKNQKHAEQTIVCKNKSKIVQQEVTISKLRSFFENSNYDFIKRVEMITIISEGIIPGVNIYIKRLPKIENRVMDIFGKKEDIKMLLSMLLEKNSMSLLNLITDRDLADQNFSKYNLRFADINSVIEEELNMYKLTKEEKK